MSPGVETQVEHHGGGGGAVEQQKNRIHFLNQQPSIERL